MSATNRGFSYIVNTTNEDHQAVKSLSGWGPLSAVRHRDLSDFDTLVRAKILQLQRVLFSACDDLEPQLLEVLKLTVIANHPSIVELQTSAEVGVVAQIRRCVAFSGIQETEILAWSEFAQSQKKSPPDPTPAARDESLRQESTPLSTQEQTHMMLKAVAAQNKILLEQTRGPGEVHQRVIPFHAPKTVNSTDPTITTTVASTPACSKVCQKQISATCGPTDVQVSLHDGTTLRSIDKNATSTKWLLPSCRRSCMMAACCASAMLTLSSSSTARGRCSAELLSFL
jgi:hypothetical protein